MKRAAKRTTRHPVAGTGDDPAQPSQPSSRVRRKRGGGRRASRPTEGPLHPHQGEVVLQPDGDTLIVESPAPSSDDPHGNQPVGGTPPGSTSSDSASATDPACTSIVPGATAETTTIFPQPVESLLAFFTPAGWGAAVKQSGLTEALIAQRLQEIVAQQEDPGASLAAMKFFLQHTQAALRFGNVYSVVERRLREIADKTGNPMSLESTTREIKLNLPAAGSTEEMLRQQVRGIPQRSNKDESNVED